MQYFRWMQNGYIDNPHETQMWYIEKIELSDVDPWTLKSGQRIDNWKKDVAAYFNKEARLIDFPFSAYDIPIFSPKLIALMESNNITNIQFLPLKIINSTNKNAIDGYCIANYLDVIDCLDRNLSIYEVWTKENLLYWEERPWMLNTYRDVKRIVLSNSKTVNSPVFRLKGWEVAVIVREDVKKAIEQANITGCVFSEIESP